MKILVTGGAGYIGAHFVNKAKDIHEILVVDNFIEGKENLIDGVRYEDCNIRDNDKLLKIFQEFKPDAVEHFAAISSISFAREYPEGLYATNLQGSLNVLDCMKAVGCNKIVFSSSAAIYEGGKNVKEDSTKNPQNPYGRSKLMFEEILHDYVRAYGISAVCLRPFCVGGCDEEGKLGVWHNPQRQLIPNLILSFLGKKLIVHGYGDATRDFIHVNDVVSAHLLAIEKCKFGFFTYNVCSSVDYNAVQLIGLAQNLFPQEPKFMFDPDQFAPPLHLVGDNSKIKRELGWEPRRGIQQILLTEYNFFHAHRQDTSR